MKTWRDYVADGRVPAAARDRDPVTGMYRWDAAEVRRYQREERPGRGSRTDRHSVTAAAMLLELSTEAAPTVDRAELRARWLDRHPDQDRSLPPGGGRTAGAGTVAHKRLSNALRTLERAGAITRGDTTIDVTDRDLLRRTAAGATEPG